MEAECGYNSSCKSNLTAAIFISEKMGRTTAVHRHTHTGAQLRAHCGSLAP